MEPPQAGRMDLATAFDLLLAAHAALAAVALWRMWPSLLIFTANQLVVLRALSLAARFGQPRSQAFLPPSVFSNSSLEIAAALFALELLILAAAILWPVPRPRPPEPLPAVPRWLWWGLWLYFLAVALSQRTVFEYSYVDPQRTTFGFNLSGVHSLLASVFLFEVVRRVRTQASTPLRGFAALFLVFLFTDFLKGSTGLASGFVVTAGVVLVRQEEGQARRLLLLGGLLLLTVTMAVAVRSVRTDLHDQGVAAVSGLADQLGAQEAAASRNAEGLELQGNGTQYAAHLLECISLYEAGISREWRSIYLPLEYTFKPSFLVGPLGLDRPKEAAWELGEYYIHGGGIFVLGELYWNGGYLCVGVVLAFLLWWCRKLDATSPYSAVSLLLLCEFAPNLLQGVGYGFAQIARGILNGLVALLVWKVAARWSPRARPA
jgi:hypothetical protein